MANTLTNQATVNYEYPSGTSTAVSNIATTVTQDEYALNGTKYALEDGFRPGSSVTFIIRIENIGTGIMYNPQFTDKLEGVYYRIPTLKLFINSVAVPVTPFTSTPWLSAYSETPLHPGDVALFMFVVDVPEDYDPSLQTLTNCVNVGGNKGSPTGPAYAIEDASCVVLYLDEYASLSISKVGSPTVVAIGDVLTYTITLSNSGNQSVTNSVLTDTLPPSFNISAVRIIKNGVTTNLSSTDYALDTSTNTVTIPSLTGPTIVVDPAVLGVPGQTTVQIVGTIS